MGWHSLRQDQAAGQATDPAALQAQYVCAVGQSAVQLTANAFPSLPGKQSTDLPAELADLDLGHNGASFARAAGVDPVQELCCKHPWADRDLVHVRSCIPLQIIIVIYLKYKRLYRMCWRPQAGTLEQQAASWQA